MSSGSYILHIHELCLIRKTLKTNLQSDFGNFTHYKN